MPARRRILPSFSAALAAVVAAAALAPATVLAAHVADSVPDAGGWTTDGVANDVVRSGDRVYVGGDFSVVGPPTGPLTALDATSGALQPGLPYVDGATAATVPDGSGGWYVGGAFERIGDVAQPWLAHVTADGAVDPAFAPQLDGVVAALALSPDGETLYAAGGFDAAGGLARPGAVALDAGSGAPRTDWDAGLSPDDAVVAIAADAGSVYLGGAFPAAGGQPRPNLAQLDAVTGAATAWTPAPNGDVLELVLAGGTLYAAGGFGEIAGQPLTTIASFDAGGATPVLNAGFAPLLDGSVQAIAAGGGRVFLGGGFTTVNGEARVGAAAVDPATGAPLAGWDAALENGDQPVEVTALAVAGDRLYLGGRLRSATGEPRTNLAQVRTADGQPTEWTAVAGRGLTTLTPGAGGVVTGGTLDTVGGVARRNLAAFDGDTGTVTDWDPDADGFVLDLAAGPGGTIYASGIFFNVGGLPRPFAAAMDPLDGAVTPWDPQPGGAVFAIAPTAGAVFLGGDFASVGPAAEPRLRLAAVSPSTGAVLPWQADVEGTVTSLAADGGTLYLAGPGVTDVAGLRRRSAAALDADSGDPLPWNPLGGLPRGDPGVVNALALDGDRLVLGGTFEAVDGGSGPHPRGHAAVYAIGGATPLLTAADPRADEPVEHVGVHRGAAYVAGAGLTELGGQPRGRAGAFDADTGAVLPWAPEELAVQRLAVADDGTVDVTGTVVADGRRADLAVFSMAPAALDGVALVQTAGDRVTCERGAWDGSLPMTFAYAWTRDGAPLAAASGVDFPATSREGLGCTVTATNRAGTASAAVSVPRPPVPPPAPPAGGTPTPTQTRPPAAAPRPRRAFVRSLPARVLVRGGVARVKLACGGERGRCQGTLRLTLRLRGVARGVPATTSARRRRGGARRRPRTLLLGSSPFSIPAGRSVTASVRLSRPGRARLLAAPGRRLTVTAQAGPARRTLVLQAARPRVRRR